MDFYFVDVDEAPDLARQFRVRSIPALIIVQGGKVIGQTVGAAPEANVRRFVETSIQ